MVPNCWVASSDNFFWQGQWQKYDSIYDLCQEQLVSCNIESDNWLLVLQKFLLLETNMITCFQTRWFLFQSAVTFIFLYDSDFSKANIYLNAIALI